MPITFAQSQSKLLQTDWLDFNADEEAMYIVIEDTLSQYGELFLKNLEKYANERQVVATGNMISKTKVNVIEGNGSQILRISLPYYFDFVNEGVKGVKSTKNAPKSPYRFKTLTGMSAEGRRSLKKYIQSGKAKVRLVDKPVGTETKGKRLQGKKKQLIERQLDQLIYNIKKYGIKATRFFDDAFEDTFKDLDVVISQQIGKTIAISIEKTFK